MFKCVSEKWFWRCDVSEVKAETFLCLFLLTLRRDHVHPLCSGHLNLTPSSNTWWNGNISDNVIFIFVETRQWNSFSFPKERSSAIHVYFYHVRFHLKSLLLRIRDCSCVSCVFWEVLGFEWRKEERPDLNEVHCVLVLAVPLFLFHICFLFYMCSDTWILPFMWLIPPYGAPSSCFICMTDEPMAQIDPFSQVCGGGMTICTLTVIRGCIQKFRDCVDNEINNNKHSLRSNAKGYGGKTH